MRKKIFLSLLISLYFSIQSFSQNYKVIYRFDVDRMEDSLVANTVPKRERGFNIIKKALPYLKNYESVLNINKNEASYQIENKMDNDAGNTLALKIAKTIAGVNDPPVYQNINSGYILKPQKIGEEEYIVKYPFENYHWEITDETKNIKGFKTKKATTKIKTGIGDNEKYIKVIAWFAPDIPLPFGPSEFGGLPGLILQLGGRHMVTLKSIEEQEQIKNIKKPRGKIITRDEYLEKFQKHYGNDLFEQTMEEYQSNN